MKTGHRAFTLLELAIALAAMAIIAAFAMPSWHAQVARSHRVEAVTALYRAAQFVDTQTSVPAALPTGMDQAPATGPPVYRLRLVAADESNGGYAIEAIPESTGPMREDACGTFTLDATGARGNRPVAAEASAALTENCWRGR
ncbi:type IV pilin protein [Paraburkholderia sp. J12]|uniref:type IV pilin protein n=1 Tax=Paraburkholderia sp. J12 TaxID=2805432 RepID=UPI002ABDC582|nr:type IV pilin protein [Paraburkholderia sp. J12]